MSEITTLPPVQAPIVLQATGCETVLLNASLEATSDAKMRTNASPSKEVPMADANGDVFTLPDYTINDLRRAIPAECFDRSWKLGLFHIVKDITILGTICWTFQHFLTPENVPSTLARGVLWAVYGFINGLFGTGLWIMGHESGHQALSTSKVFNDTMGFICHSMLLVPYFSWKISHGKHHKATGHMQRDMAHLPLTKEQYSGSYKTQLENLDEVLEDAPLYTFLSLFAQQLYGWPVYLFANFTGHNNHEKQPEGRGIGKKNGWTFIGGVNHFDPNSPLYEAKDAKWILVSDVGCLMTLTALYFVAQSFGWWNVALWYLQPYLWVNHWIVAITYLQHSDPTLPHYNAGAWTFLRGAAATIDRDLGFVGTHIFHGIAETHVLHHHISTIPFYNADKASEAIKPILGTHYRSDVRGGPIGFVKAMYAVYRSCQWVEPTPGVEGVAKDVLFYRNRNGIQGKSMKAEN